MFVIRNELVPLFGAAGSCLPPQGSRSGAPKGGLSSYSITLWDGIAIPAGRLSQATRKQHARRVAADRRATSTFLLH